MTSESAQRLCIRLDPAMLLEGLLLDRLSLIPKGRRQEWLRGLLVQGYLWEGRTSRGAQGDTEVARPGGEQAKGKGAASATAFAGWLARPQAPVQPAVPKGSRPPRPVPSMSTKSRGGKPFAHLRKVIG
jgi:hypothetical protein